MSVVSARVLPWGGPCAPVGTSRSSWDERRGALLVLAADDGTRGLGEATPLPGYSPDTLESCRTALESLAALLPIELDPRATALEQLVAVAERLDPAAPAARMAVETALLDLLGRRAGLPACALLRGEACLRPVEVSALLAGEDAAGLGAGLCRGMARGITVFKVKVGAPGRFEEELAALQELRRRHPGGWKLRLDANGAWSPEEAREKLCRLARVRPELVEQPVAPEALPAFTGAPVPLAADESLRLPGALDELLASRACAALVLKPTVLGGPGRCLEIARRAGAAGLRTVVTHTFEGPAALALARALALALEPAPLACGVDLHPALAAFPAPFPSLSSAALVEPTDRPGLGLDLRVS